MPTDNSTLLPSLEVITSMITPAILIVAGGSLVASTLVRMSGINDQARRLIVRGIDLRRAHDQAGLEFLNGQLDRLLRRNDLVRNALLWFYLAVSLFLLSSLVIGLTELLWSHLSWIGPAIVMLGAIFLFVGSASLVLEVNISSGTIRREVEMLRAGGLDASEM